jgi:hypothetical protein
LVNIIRYQAEARAWDDLARHLSPNLVGQILTRLRLTQERNKHGRFYTIDVPTLARLIDAYRLSLPDILTAYTRFREETLRANLPPNTPGGPLKPPSPAILALLTKTFTGPLAPKPK